MEKLELTKTGETKFFYDLSGDEKVVKDLQIIVRKPLINHRVTIKAVVTDSAFFDLKATLTVLKGAVNTDTYLKIACLIISEKASVNVIPGLEIHEDAVKAGHGATVSTINTSELDYLTSRGLTKKQAQDLIIKGFMAK